MSNNVDVEKLNHRRKTIAANPSLGKKKPTVKTRWLGGMKSATEVRGFKIHVDEPEEIGGSDSAPTPTEALLASLGACLTVGYSANAAILGIEIDEIEVELKGNIDQGGFFGLSQNRGYKSIDVTVHIESTASEGELEKLHRFVYDTSPVGNTLLNNTDVNVNMVRTSITKSNE